MIGVPWAIAGAGGCRCLYKGNDVNDSSGNGNTLTNVNSVGFSAGKIANNAFDFGSHNANKKLTAASSLMNMYNSPTGCHFWYCPTTQPALGEFQMLIDYGSGVVYPYSPGGYCEVHYANRAGTTGIELWASSETETLYPITLTTGAWCYIEVASQESDGNCKVFLNGREIISATGGGSTGGGDLLMIGNLTEGKLQHLAFSNFARTPAQHRRWYAWTRGMLV